MKLYELTDEYQRIIDALEDSENPEAETELQLALSDIIDDISIKGENIAKIITGYQSEVVALETEVGRLAKRAQSAKRSAERLQHYLQEQMVKSDTQRIDGAAFTIWRQRNGKASLEFIADVPDEYKYTPEPVPDAARIREILENGAELSFAKLERGEHLRIK